MWFDAVEIGAVTELGNHHFTAANIVRFARAFDPQPFHLSEVAGKASLFGGLAASGWHTASAWQSRLTAHEESLRTSALERGETLPPQVFSPDVRDLRWLKPVLAGDTLHFRLTVTGKAVGTPDPGWGVVTALGEGFNQRGERAFQLTLRQIRKIRA